MIKRRKLNTARGKKRSPETNNSNEFIMKPKVDFCFKGIMENPKARIGFCAAILGKGPEEIESTELLPTILNNRNKEEKYSVLDVRIRLKDGTQMDIEMQVVNQGDWPERSVYYLAKMFVEQLQIGESYRQLQKCIHVGILDFTLFEEYPEYYHTVFHINEDCLGVRYTDKLEFHVLELLKLPLEVDGKNKLLEWMQFFRSESKEDLKRMSVKDKYIKEACDEVIRMSADEKKKLEYERRMKVQRDYASGMSWAKEQGIERGLELGLEQGIQQGMEQGIQQGMEQGIQQGMEQGIQQGMEQGIQQGMEQGIQQGIEKQKVHTEEQRRRAEQAEERIRELQEQLKRLEH